jgi:hypothetical protein
MEKKRLTMYGPKYTHLSKKLEEVRSSYAELLDLLRREKENDFGPQHVCVF